MNSQALATHGDMLQANDASFQERWRKMLETHKLHGMQGGSLCPLLPCPPMVKWCTI
jgi:hypothetical protein